MNQIILARAWGKSYRTISEEFEVTSREIARVSTGKGVLHEYHKLAQEYLQLEERMQNELWNYQVFLGMLTFLTIFTIFTILLSY